MKNAEFDRIIRRASEVIRRVQNPATRPYSETVKLGEGWFTVRTVWPRAKE